MACISQDLKLTDIRFSQSTVSGNNDEEELGDYTWNEERYRPVTVVLMNDGKYTSHDNRRIIRALNGGKQSIRALVHENNAHVPANSGSETVEFVWQSVTFPNSLCKMRCTPKNMQSVIELCCGRNEQFPVCGSDDLPTVVSNRKGFIRIAETDGQEHAITANTEGVKSDFAAVLHNTRGKVYICSRSRLFPFYRAADITRLVDILSGEFWSNVKLVAVAESVEEWNDGDHQAFNDWEDAEVDHNILMEVQYEDETSK